MKITVWPARTIAIALVLLAPGEAAARCTVAVAAASSLEPAFAALAATFEATHPGCSISATFGATGTFVAQIENGAPFDVLLSADRDGPRKLAADGLGRGEVLTWAHGSLVLWTATEAGAGVEHLAGPAIRRVAVPNPRVAPYGRAAMDVLRSAGVYAAVQPKLVVAESALQALQFARSGAVDAALLPRTLALPGSLPRGTVRALAEGPLVEYGAVVLSRARDPALAHAFLGFLLGPEARAILASRGYEP